MEHSYLERNVNFNSQSWQEMPFFIFLVSLARLHCYSRLTPLDCAMCFFFFLLHEVNFSFLIIFLTNWAPQVKSDFKHCWVGSNDAIETWVSPSPFLLLCLPLLCLHAIVTQSLATCWAKSPSSSSVSREASITILPLGTENQGGEEADQGKPWCCYRREGIWIPGNQSQVRLLSEKDQGIRTQSMMTEFIGRIWS